MAFNLALAAIYLTDTVTRDERGHLLSVGVNSAELRTYETYETYE